MVAAFAEYLPCELGCVCGCGHGLDYVPSPGHRYRLGHTRQVSQPWTRQTLTRELTGSVGRVVPLRGKPLGHKRFIYVSAVCGPVPGVQGRLVRRHR